VTVGSMDHPDAMVPAAHIWTSSQLAWLHLGDDLPRHAGEDPGERDVEPRGYWRRAGAAGAARPDAPAPHPGQVWRASIMPRSTGSRSWMPRVPPYGPADTPTTPTALWMYSSRQLSSACFKRPEYPWLYSGETTTRASARLICAEKVGSLIAWPASSMRRGMRAMSISSVSIPGRRESSDTTSLATGRLMRPWRTVPRRTGTKSARPGSVTRALSWRESRQGRARGLRRRSPRRRR